MKQLASVISSPPSSAEENFSHFKELRNIYEKQETTIRNFEEKATWLSVAYVIFGAILYNIIVQYSSSELPLNRWLPISLLLSVSVSFWLQLLRTILRYLRISNQSDISWMEQERMYYRLFIDKKRQTKFSHGTSTDLTFTVSSSSRHQRYVYIFAVLSALFIFTLAVLHACLSILCHSAAQIRTRQ